MAGALTGEGWPDANGSRITDQPAGSLLGPLRRRANLLDLWTRPRDYRTEQLTPVGQAAAEEALTLHALSPRTRLG